MVRFLSVNMGQKGAKLAKLRDGILAFRCTYVVMVCFAWGAGFDYIPDAPVLPIGRRDSDFGVYRNLMRRWLAVALLLVFGGTSVYAATHRHHAAHHHRAHHAKRHHAHHGA